MKVSANEGHIWHHGSELGENRKIIRDSLLDVLSFCFETK